MLHQQSVMLILYLPKPQLYIYRKLYYSFYVVPKIIINIWKTSPHRKLHVMTMVIIRMTKKMIKVIRMTKLLEKQLGKQEDEGNENVN